VTTSAGSIWGYSYLAWNGSVGYNCVVTHKTAYHGTPTRTDAYLAVGSLNTFVSDVGNYSHYAVVKRYARNKCVAYYSAIDNPDGSRTAAGGRWSLGNCG